MTGLTPTRSLAIALREEQRTMREGYVFLDEKCMLLAVEMLRQVRAWQSCKRLCEQRLTEARLALAGAIGRHGTNGLQVQPAAPGPWQLAVASHLFFGVRLQQVRLYGTAGTPPAAPWPSPEARACSAAYAALLAPLAELAGHCGNLARLHAEYRRTVRRVRALQYVLLPEVESKLRDVDAALEEVELDEAVVVRRLRR